MRFMIRDWQLVWRTWYGFVRCHGTPSSRLTAIDNYRAIPLTAESWFAGARECWERARALVAMLGKGSGERKAEIIEAVLAAFRTAQSSDDFLGLQLAEFVRNLVVENRERLSIACRLQRLAEEFDQSGNRHAARDYYDGAAGWYGLAGDEQQSTAMIVAAAECWVKEGDERLSGDQPSHTAAGFLYERAVQKYRSIPKSERGPHDVDKRLADLRKRVRASGAESLEEMSTIAAPAIDIGAIVDKSRQAVTGKSSLDALTTYVNLYPGANVKQLKETATQSLQAHPLQALLSTVVVGDDGRIVARRSGMNLSTMDSRDTVAAIHAEMVSTYVTYVHSVVYSVVLPGLEVLRLEHRLREGDFGAIAAGSPAVPPGRSGLFGKALFAGYEWDFATSIHILAPQVEHMVRFHLKKIGIQTTTLDPTGVETENGLSALMGLPESETILGTNIAFEVKALFCDGTGPNIRNDVAHGLFSEEKCKATTSVYAWWLGLKIVFNSFRHVLHSEAKNEGSDRDGSVEDGE